MAEPIPIQISRDPREELTERLNQAPVEHAEALLALYQVIQGLHDTGLLEMAGGALGNSESLMELGVKAVNSPGPIRGIRNLLILVQLLGQFEPDELKGVLDAVTAPTEPLGAIALAKKFNNPDTRRALTKLQAALEAFGRNPRPSGGEGR